MRKKLTKEERAELKAFLEQVQRNADRTRELAEQARAERLKREAEAEQKQ